MSKKLFILLAAVLIICFIETARCVAEAKTVQKLNPVLVDKTVNEFGGKLSYKVEVDKTGWSFIVLPFMPLGEGINSITVASDLPQTPAIEFIRVENPVDGRSKALISTAYDEYIDNIRDGIRRRALGTGDASITKTDSLVNVTIDLDGDQVPYSFNYYDIPWFGYTFYTAVYLKKRQSFHCVSEAQGQQMHFLEIFSADSPDPYSWTRVSQNGKTDRTITIPYTGLYFVRVRTHKNGSTGLCSLNINDELFYEDVPMCSMGVRSNFALTTDEYNVFTANCKGDPFLCINKGNDLNGVVWSFNDDYFGEGDFDWGRNARIKRTFSSTTNTSRILVLSSVSFDPVGNCELYVGCRNYPINDYFVNLKRDDALISAPASSNYKCIGWTGGMTNYPWWPGSTASPYYNAVQDNLSSIDRFYSRQRYPGCAKYTREGATEDNSVIDLWGIRSDSPSVADIYRHASIRHTSDENHHGYDWESKLGTEERIFHPRYAVENFLYGKVLFHYRISDDSPKNPITLDMSLAEDRAVMENVVLSNHQEEFLENQISDIDNEVLTKFNALYSAWDNVWNHTIQSNPEVIKKEGLAYDNLKTYCQNTDAVKYLVYDKLNRGITSCVPLFEDLYVASVESNYALLQRIHRSNDVEMYDEDGRQIIKTPI